MKPIIRVNRDLTQLEEHDIIGKDEIFEIYDYFYKEM